LTIEVELEYPGFTQNADKSPKPIRLALTRRIHYTTELRKDEFEIPREARGIFFNIIFIFLRAWQAHFLSSPYFANSFTPNNNISLSTKIIESFGNGTGILQELSSELRSKFC
jgi:hypothetical protein